MAYVWDAVDGARLLEGFPADFTGSQAFDINELGQIVGEMHGSTVLQRAFLWDPVTGVQNLGILPGGGDISSSIAQAINDVSQVVGTAVTERGDRAFLWEDGVMIELGGLPMGAVRSYAVDINNAGQVVGAVSGTDPGTEHFVPVGCDQWRAAADLIDPLLGWTIIEAQAINDAGQIAVSGFQPTTCQISTIVSMRFCLPRLRYRSRAVS